MRRLLSAAAIALVSGLAHAADTPDLGAASLAGPQAHAAISQSPPVTLDSLLHPGSMASTHVSTLRAQMLMEVGKTVGFRGGMAARARELVAALKGRADRLDSLFGFAPLISQDDTLPPVIVEARDLAAFAPDQIRTATRAYKIYKPERFVSVPPTWRDYLYVGLPFQGSVDLPAFEARPKDSAEAAIWREAVQAGWTDGQRQADAVLAANFNRLTRDYTGMLLYSTLFQQGLVTLTKVVESHQTVTGHRDQLVLGDSLRRIASKAEFETDASKWTPVITAMPLPITASVTTPPGMPPAAGNPIATPADKASASSGSLLGATFNIIGIRDNQTGRIELRFEDMPDAFRVTGVDGKALDATWDNANRVLSFKAVDRFSLATDRAVVDVARAANVQYRIDTDNTAGLERVFEEGDATYLIFRTPPASVSAFNERHEGSGELKDRYYKFHGIAKQLTVVADGGIAYVARVPEVRFFERPGRAKP